MMEEVLLSELIEDQSLYPRMTVDDVHVSDLVRALASGATLPPIVAEAHTLRIVDGVHRRRALLKFFGDEVKSAVELRTYDSESALFIEAVALNSVHGRRLDRQDQTRIVLKLREFGIDNTQISIYLHVPAPVIEKLALRIINDEAGDAHPAKRGLEHMHGQTLSGSQIQAASSVRSAEIGRLCIEITKLLEARLVNLQDKRIREQLRQVAAIIEASLESVAA